MEAMTVAPATDSDRSVPGWWHYLGDGQPHDWTPPPAPPWRQFDGKVEEPSPTESDAGVEHSARDQRLRRLAAAYRAEPKEARLVNTAIYLRRPLLVTGRPGTGKSMLAHSIAHELGLGRVLQWSVTSRTTLQHGLYHYDAVGRLQEVNLLAAQNKKKQAKVDIGGYIRLGPLGTALLPRRRPRVLLIDEIDKGDVDLPGDLLAVFEEGSYRIPELERLPDSESPVSVMTDDGPPRVPIDHGTVVCHEFPIVVLTSNGERDFPPAFVRRCIRLDLEPPSGAKLNRILEAHLGTVSAQATNLVTRVLETRRLNPHALLATDQLLNAIRMEDHTPSADDQDWHEVIDALLRPLNETGSP
jgi:MoxR-like ATPase